MATLLERIVRLEAAKASLRDHIARVLDGAARAARWAHLVSIADPLAPATKDNRRACRAAELAYLAQDRAAAAGDTFPAPPPAPHWPFTAGTDQQASSATVNGIAAGLAEGESRVKPFEKAECVGLMEERVRQREQEDFQRLLKEQEN